MSNSILYKNRTVLDKMFRAHSSWLMGWLGKQRWTVHSSDDLTSDVFCALLTIPNLEAVSQPRAMMTTIARRLIHDARRRDDLRRSYESELMALPEALEISAEERLILIQALQSLQVMLSTLSHKSQTAFLRSQIEGVSYAEIADELGVSVSMVRKYVAQGLRAAYAAVDRQG